MLYSSRKVQVSEWVRGNPHRYSTRMHRLQRWENSLENSLSQSLRHWLKFRMIYSEPLIMIPAWNCSYWIFKQPSTKLISTFFCIVFHIVLASLPVHASGSDHIWPLRDCESKRWIVIVGFFTVFPRVVSLALSYSCFILHPWVILWDTITLTFICMPMIRNYILPLNPRLLIWQN